jgi:hypothetical protein
MKAATIKEIKSALETMSNDDLVSFNLRLARYKKENKELLTYLLFESFDEIGYVSAIKSEIDAGFNELKDFSVYIIKKKLRKIIRLASKFIRYSSVDTTEVEILIYLCQKINESKIPLEKSTVLMNLYLSLKKKIITAIDSMHEDLQYDFNLQIKKLV